MNTTEGTASSYRPVISSFSYPESQSTKEKFAASEVKNESLKIEEPKFQNKTIDQFQVETKSVSEFDLLYQRTSMVESKRLIMTHFKNSEEEVSLVRKMNLEFFNKESKWTPIMIPDGSSNELIKNCIELKKLNGDFFSRTWVISDKERKTAIGIMTTSRLSGEGLSVITRHILKDYTGKGLGSEALLSIFDHYQKLRGMPIPKIDRTNLKSRIQKNLFDIAEELLNKTDLAQFKEYFSGGDFSNIDDLYRVTKPFPNSFGANVRSALCSLEKANRVDYFSGFISDPISEAAVRSLKKCGFVKSGCEYKKNCSS